MRIKTVVSVIFALAAAALIAAAAGIIKGRLEKRDFPLVYPELVKRCADEYELDPYLIEAIINVESSVRPDAVSGAGAAGLMQIMPDTGEWIAGKLKLEEYDLTYPETNISIGCWYLKFLNGRFDDSACVIAAYNAGHNAVKKWLDGEYSSDGTTLDEIPYPETRDYVKKVQRAYEKYKQIYPEGFAQAAEAG